MSYTQDHNQLDKRRIAKNTLYLYIRMFLVLIVGLYTSRVVLKTLGISDYGVYNVVGGFVAMLSYLNVVFVGTTQRYLSFSLGQGEKERLKTVFSTAVIIHYSIALIILIVAETFGLWFVNAKLNIDPSRMIAANWVYQCSVVTLMVSIISVPYNACIVAHERMNVYAIINIFQVILKLFGVIALAYLPFDALIAYAVLLLILSIAERLVNVTYCKKRFEESKFHVVRDKALIKEMFSYSGWSFLGTLGFTFKDQFSNIIMNLFLGTTINAARGVCTQVTGVIENFAHNILVAITPQITKQYASGNLEESKNLVYLGARLTFYMMALVMVPCFINLDYLLQLWLVTVPDYTSVFIKISLVIALLYSVNSPVSTAIEATGNIKQFQIGVAIIMLLELPIAYIVLKLGYEPYYALLPGIITTFVALLFRLYLVKKVNSDYSYRYYLLVIVGKGLLIFFGCLFVCSRINSLFTINIFTFFVSSVISLIVTAIVVFFLGLESREREFARSWVKNKLRIEKQK